MFPSLFASKKTPKSPQSPSGTEEREDNAASGFASVVTPNANKGSNYKSPNQRVIVAAHTRSSRNVKRSSNAFSKTIKIGTIVARSFNTWPCSRTPGDPPVRVKFHGMVTEINPRTKKIQVLFENS